MDYLNDYLPTSLSSYIFPVEEPTYDIFLLKSVEEYLPKILEWRIHEAAPQWTTVPLISLLVFGLLKQYPGKVHGVETYALLHCLLTGPLALLCLYYDLSSVQITGVPEPLRTITCSPPLTSLHTFLPLITLGYALLDLFEGLYNLQTDFIIHGLSLTILFGFISSNNQQHTIACTLIMEVSTIPLQFLKCKFNDTVMLGVNLCFLISFIGARLAIVPYLWYKWLVTYYDVSGEGCYPGYFVYLVWGFGVVFHGLNVYWAYKIFKKVLRKAGGKEKMADNDKLD
ncbi:hypothetical protein TrST_g7305 [Triparma strigata]|uniref:TLC domain-containing protein n=1 Tax=Triparma strigata TaxID=1606541 RepID=A0A9W7EUJ6_9STRA|nr:hypothetical protein TrST_g7305 [Triparma strigata]